LLPQCRQSLKKRYGYKRAHEVYNKGRATDKRHHRESSGQEVSVVKQPPLVPEATDKKYAHVRGQEKKSKSLVLNGSGEEQKTA